MNRRSFLKAGAALAGAAVTPTIPVAGFYQANSAWVEVILPPVIFDWDGI